MWPHFSERERKDIVGTFSVSLDALGSNFASGASKASCFFKKGKLGCRIRARKELEEAKRQGSFNRYFEGELM